MKMRTPTADAYGLSLRDRTELVSRVAPFSDLPASEARRIAERFVPRRVCRGEFVFLQGQPADTFNLLACGRVKVIRELPHRQVILRLIYPGEIFGVSGGWGQVRYPASARALDDSVVLRLPAREFNAVLARHSETALAVIRDLGARLREAEARIIDLQTVRVEQRIARTLLQLAERSAGDDSRVGRVSIPLTRQDLADLSGTTLSTASRTLSSWHRRGFLLAEREQVTLLDPDAIRALAEDDASLL